MKEFKTNTQDGIFTASICDELVVNDELEWQLQFIANKKIDINGSIKILVPAYQHQRSEEYLQTYDYWKPNYIYAIGEDDDIQVNVRIEKVPSAFSHIRDWVDSNRIAIVTFPNGLEKGDKIIIKFGGVDRPWLEGECSPSRVSQFAYKNGGTYLEYEVYIDTDGSNNYKAVDVFPKVEIVPDKAEKIILTTNSVVRVDEKFNINVNVVDRFNNPIIDYNTNSMKLILINLETKENIVIKKENEAFTASVKEEGLYEITAIDEELYVEKAVFVCDCSMEKLYWGDIHNHSNLTANIRDNDCGASPKQGYLYAKEVSCLDYICLSEQTFLFNEDTSVNINKNTWEKIGQEADKYYKKDELVTFPGVELHSKRGDTVVLFRDSLNNYPYPSEDVTDIQDIWSYYKGKHFLTIPHFHRYCDGRPNKDQQERKYSGFEYSNWKENSEQEVICEVFSSQWGRFENGNHPMILKARANVKGNTVVDFLNKGKKWGITASSDGHDGKPGYGGITGVYASEKTRESIFNSLSNRKTIASTHPRLIIKFDINGHDMGNIVDNNNEVRNINLKVVAPEKIEKIEIIKNGEIFIKSDCSDNYINKTFIDDNEIEKNTYYYIRVILKNGHIGWTSPIWFNI
ncbi:MAG: DUF3604 domain-containing protein [Vallitalea sp.]|jgi:hypothetical protein|nr:DUF3604 domain-containing protein [Vallitalea sp.]